MSSIDIPAIQATVVTATGGRATASKSFHIPSLDGVRALAFLIVFVSHAGLKDLVPGGFGVTIFFVLSGYLITTLLRIECEERRSIDLLAFYIRRSVRILPLLYLTLATAIVLKLLNQISGEMSAVAIFSQVFHWSNYYLISHSPESVIGGTIVLWSLAVEEHFYLLFPVIFRFLRRNFSIRSQAVALISGCAACLLWRLVLIIWMHQPSVRTELGTDTRFDGLLFGCLMAITLNPSLDHSPWLSLKRLRWAALLGLAILLFTFIYRNEEFRYTWRFSLQGIALLPLFAFVIKSRNSLVFRVLNTRWAVQLGTLSYSLYLIHAIILDWVNGHLRAPKVVIGAVTLGLAIVIAKVLQLAVEKPLYRLRRQYLQVRPSSV